MSIKNIFELIDFLKLKKKETYTVQFGLTRKITCIFDGNNRYRIIKEKNCLVYRGMNL